MGFCSFTLFCHLDYGSSEVGGGMAGARMWKENRGVWEREDVPGGENWDVLTRGFV